MNNTFNAIVNPVVTKKTPDPGETAVLVSSASDLDLLKQCPGFEDVAARSLFMSRHYLGTCGPHRTSIAGPLVGAPYAVMLMDTLVAWGVKKFLFLGWCGSISARLGIGDIVVPDRAFIDEGTSTHYLGKKDVALRPEGDLPGQIMAALKQAGVGGRQGAVWTTDAIYRETSQRVIFFQGKGALAVEMEVSALFSAARFRGVEICCLLVTSDLLFNMQWQPGFKDRRFKEARKSAVEIIFQVLSIG